MIRKKTEKRRKKYEMRLGPGVYMPKDERLQFNADVEEAAAAALKEQKEWKVQKEKEKAAKKAAKAAPAADKEAKPEAK